MALNEARGRLHVCQQYSVRHQSLFVGGGGRGRRVLKDLGCVTIELDLIPLRLCNILMTPLIAR